MNIFESQMGMELAQNVEQKTESMESKLNTLVDILQEQNKKIDAILERFDKSLEISKSIETNTKETATVSKDAFVIIKQDGERNQVSHNMWMEQIMKNAGKDFQTDMITHNLDTNDRY